MFKFLKDIVKILQDKKVRLIKAILTSFITILALVFFIDTNWLTNHIVLDNSLVNLKGISVLSKVVCTIFGLDLIEDLTKITLISLMILALSIITIIAFFSWIVYIIVFAFMGAVIRKVWLNYIAGSDILYKIPGTNITLIERKWTIEEKHEIVDSTVNAFFKANDYPNWIIDIERLKEVALNFNSKSEILNLVNYNLTECSKNP